MTRYRFLIAAVMAALAPAALSASQAFSSDGPQSTSAAVSAWPLADGLLMVPAMQNLDGGQQLSDEALAKRLNPSAVAARARSRTAFHGLDAAVAARVTREQLPGVVATASTGLSDVPAGGRVERYLSGYSACISLPGGKHAV